MTAGPARRDIAGRGDISRLVAEFYRRALRPHIVLDAEVKLTSAHFARWLALWAATVDERHVGEKTELAKVQATRIAGSINRRLRGQSAMELVTIRSQPSDQRPS